MTALTVPTWSLAGHVTTADHVIQQIKIHYLNLLSMIIAGMRGGMGGQRGGMMMGRGGPPGMRGPPPGMSSKLSL